MPPGSSRSTICCRALGRVTHLLAAPETTLYQKSLAHAPLQISSPRLASLCHGRIEHMEEVWIVQISAIARCPVDIGFLSHNSLTTGIYFKQQRSPTAFILHPQH
jgi:hypothetical protein